MGFFPGMDALVEKLLTHIVEEYAVFVALGGYILAVMAIGTLVLTLAIIYLSVDTPVKLVKKIYKESKDEHGD